MSFFLSKYTGNISKSNLTAICAGIDVVCAGIPKKGDKFKLPKIYFKYIKGYIFGKNSKKFTTDLRYKIKIKKFINLKIAFNNIIDDIKKDKSEKNMLKGSPVKTSGLLFEVANAK